MANRVRARPFLQRLIRTTLAPIDHPTTLNRCPLLPLQTQRHKTSKHPKGFQTPTREDLSELRERVQEFAREPSLLSCLKCHHLAYPF